MNKALYKWVSRQLKLVSQVDDGQALIGEEKKNHTNKQQILGGG